MNYEKIALVCLFLGILIFVSSTFVKSIRKN